MLKITSKEAEYKAHSNTWVVAILNDAPKALRYNYIHGSTAEEAMQSARLYVAAPLMYSAIVKFIHRVDTGEVRSTKTYSQFKEIIKNIEPC